MSVEFRRIPLTTRFLDPRRGFEPVEVTHEVRFDPLTGAVCRIAHFPLQPPRTSEDGKDGGGAAASDPSPPCPFCRPWVHTVTPRFLPDQHPAGRLERGDCVLVPNLSPYDQHSAVVAVGSRHRVAPTALRPADLADALLLVGAFLETLPAGQRHGAVGWNYGPAAGASLDHPHLQCVAGPRLPHGLAVEVAAEAHYQERCGGSFWGDLVAAEAYGPRWLGRRGPWSALAAFAPRGLFPDVLFVAPGLADLLDALPPAVEALAILVADVSAALAKMGVDAWNLTVLPTLAAGQPPGALRARLVPRLHPVPGTASSDMTWIQLGLGEAVTAAWPERWAEQLRNLTWSLADTPADHTPPVGETTKTAHPAKETHRTPSSLSPGHGCARPRVSSKAGSYDQGRFR
jgi:UDPglucose--hexose-1-phosphate uridylyltransferase